MKKLLFALMPLLLLAITLPSLDRNPTANALGVPNGFNPAPRSTPTLVPTSPVAPSFLVPATTSTPAPTSLTPPLPTVAIWGTPGVTPDFTDVGNFLGPGTDFHANILSAGPQNVYSDKLDPNANPPRHCLYWPNMWKLVDQAVEIGNKAAKKKDPNHQDYPIPGEEQIFVYQDAAENTPEKATQIALELGAKYMEFLDGIGPEATASIAANLTMKNATTFQSIIPASDYVCEDSSDSFCMHWHDRDWCPKNIQNLQHQHEYAQCAKYDADGACKSVLTSLSNTPIETEPGALIKAIFLVTLSLAGGVSVILIIAAGYKILTSSGKPEAIQAGREQLTSAIVGLLFIIFSYVIFQFIVSDLLRIPGITK